jgi:hypothetical protein
MAPACNPQKKKKQKKHASNLQDTLAAEMGSSEHISCGSSRVFR